MHRVNITEWERMEAEYSSLYQTVHNGASRMSKVVRSVDFTSPYYIGLTVPEERELFVFSRELKLSEGDYDIDVVTSSGGFTGGITSYKSRLRDSAADTIEATLHMGVTPSGTITILDEDFVDTGTGLGSGQVGGAPAIEDVTVSIKGQSLLRITKQGGGSATVGIRLIVWEKDV